VVVVRSVVAAVVGGACLLAVSGVPDASRAAPVRGTVQIVQAVPGSSVDIAVDGKRVARDVPAGTVGKAQRLAPGSHEVTFSGAGGTETRTSVTVRPGSYSDVVLHLPAAVGGAPVVHVYPTPRTPIGPGKARVQLAHTATVPPADVRVDGRTVFTNIANGEFAEADVPAGKHAVALLPTGQKSRPILGPLTVDLAPGTMTLVYAVGTPKDGSMDVIAHVVRLSPDGSVAPDSVQTGSAGFAAHLPVRPFSWPSPTR
jgi:hypothetical protein